MNYENKIIYAYPRTGGTWIGKIFDTNPKVKYIWEPFYKKYKEFKTKKQIYNFKPHVKLKPMFKTHRNLGYAVYKIIASEYRKKFNRNTFFNYNLNYVQQKLNAKVLHLVRNPIRWMYSIKRWDKSLSNKDLLKRLENYLKNNQRIYDIHKLKNYYKIISHDEIVKNTKQKTEEMFNFFDINITTKTYEFIEECHKKTIPGVHKHHVFVEKNKVLNRWKNFNKNFVKEIKNMSINYSLFKKDVTFLMK